MGLFCDALARLVPIEQHNGKFGCPVCKRVGRELFWGGHYRSKAV
jgi:hypothetical protein